MPPTHGAGEAAKQDASLGRGRFEAAAQGHRCGIFSDITHGITAGVMDPSPSRVRVKFWVYAPLRMVWVTLLT